jgi:hypothetical protein
MRATITASTIFLLTAFIAGCGVSKKIETIQNTQVPQVTAADEMAARVRLTAISDAEARYQVENNGDYASMDVLIQNHYIIDPGKGQLARYKFAVEVGDHHFSATAVPERYPMTGRQSFYIDETNVLRGADKGGAKATANDPNM